MTQPSLALRVAVRGCGCDLGERRGADEATVGWSTRAEAFDLEARDGTALAASYARGERRGFGRGATRRGRGRPGPRRSLVTGVRAPRRRRDGPHRSAVPTRARARVQRQRTPRGVRRGVRGNLAVRRGGGVGTPGGDAGRVVLRQTLHRRTRAARRHRRHRKSSTRSEDRPNNTGSCTDTRTPPTRRDARWRRRRCGCTATRSRTRSRLFGRRRGRATVAGPSTTGDDVDRRGTGTGATLRLRELWDERAVREISMLPNVKGVVAIGCVLAVEVDDGAGGGYSSSATKDIVLKLASALHPRRDRSETCCT